MTPGKREAGFEKVYTVTDYYDGPRQGIADYNGSPHFYDCVFSEKKQDFTCFYRLTPVSAETFSLALEDWDIWKRWEHAFASNQTNLETHPALPEDAARHAAIESILASSLGTDLSKSTVRAGRFIAIRTIHLPGVLADLRVRWTEPSDSLDHRIWTDDAETSEHPDR